MKVTTIIATYNRDKFLEKTLISVINQTIPIDEIIIVDDGSTDNTKHVVKPYDIKYIFQQNQGVSSARNRGLKEVKNEWVCFLDSDDIWEETKLEKQIQFHQQNPNILFSHTDELWKFNDKVIKQKKHQYKPSGFCFEQNLANTLIGASTLMIHKSIFDDIGYFDEKLVACEDYDLWLRILTKYELGLVNEKLITKIAGHSGQLSFETPLMDSYRIKALQKHIDSKYEHKIKEEILKKCEILIKGAIKHQNKDVEEYYTSLKENILLDKK